MVATGHIDGETGRRHWWRSTCIDATANTAEVGRSIGCDDQLPGCQVLLDRHHTIDGQRGGRISPGVIDEPGDGITGDCHEIVGQDVIGGGSSRQVSESLGSDEEMSERSRARQVLGEDKFGKRCAAADPLVGHDDLIGRRHRHVQFHELDRAIEVGVQFVDVPEVPSRNHGSAAGKQADTQDQI